MRGSSLSLLKWHRERPDLQLSMMVLAFPAEPFARRD